MQEVPRADRVADSSEADAPKDASPATESKGKGRRSAKGEGAPTPSRGRDPKARASKPSQANGQTGPAPIPRLKERYRKEIAPALMKEFAYSNAMEVPGVSKVVINIGLGEALENSKAVEAAQRDLTAITGQRPVTTKAKKSVANFKVRQGNTIGMMVTLRGDRMYEFLDRLINIAMPRIRDFRGAPANAFDGRGNYSLGLREQVIFPEIDFNEIDRIRGLQVTIVTTAGADEEARSLLKHMGVAFSKETVGATA